MLDSPIEGRKRSLCLIDQNQLNYTPTSFLLLFVDASSPCYLLTVPIFSAQKKAVDRESLNVDTYLR
jgi:hypothetical protein